MKFSLQALDTSLGVICQGEPGVCKTTQAPAIFLGDHSFYVQANKHSAWHSVHASQCIFLGKLSELNLAVDLLDNDVFTSAGKKLEKTPFTDMFHFLPDTFLIQFLPLSLHDSSSP